MSQVISVRDIQEMVRSGQGVSILRRRHRHAVGARFVAATSKPTAPAAIATGPAAAPSVPASFRRRQRSYLQKSPKAELEAFFNSPYAHSLKEQICEMGHRLWKRAYVDGNGGNMAIRVGEDIAICTPTLVSKGSLKPSTCAWWTSRATSFAAPRSAPAKS